MQERHLIVLNGEAFEMGTFLSCVDAATSAERCRRTAMTAAATTKVTSKPDARIKMSVRR